MRRAQKHLIIAWPWSIAAATVMQLVTTFNVSAQGGPLAFQQGDELANIQANQPGIIRGRRIVGGGAITDEQMRLQIEQTLLTQHDLGNAWAWRDAVENRLVSFGPATLPMIRSAMSTREGYELDALQVAAFRLENVPLNPRESLYTWGTKHFGLADDPASPTPAPIRITRIFGAGGMSELFSHHLFYVLEFVPQHARTVVALAADAKIQPLDDDAALARFIRAEAEPQRSPIGRESLSSVAALLAAARSTSVYKPENVRFASQNQSSKASFDADGFRQTAVVTFDAAGIVQSVASTQEKSAASVPSPIVVPNPTAPPPPIPR